MSQSIYLKDLWPVVVNEADHGHGLDYHVHGLAFVGSYDDETVLNAVLTWLLERARTATPGSALDPMDTSASAGVVALMRRSGVYGPTPIRGHRRRRSAARPGW